MTPEMLETLYHISLLHAPEPETVFREIAEAVSAQYGGTMAMVNVMEGSCIRFHTVVNTHRIFNRLRATVNPQEVQTTLCDGAIRHRRPLLIQNAERHPEFCRHIVVRLKLRRYLGVPICNPSGEAVGTLCFLDDRIEEPLDEEDIRFLSLLAMRVSAELERERMIEARVAEQRTHAERLAAMNRRLLETAEERRHFVSMVIHDLRHPLTTLRTCLSLLRIETSKKQRNAHLDMLERRTRALSALLDELVVYDQIEAGYPLVTINEIDLAAHIRECIEEVTDLTTVTGSPHGVPIQCEVAPDLGVAHLDGGKLRHILLNLLANALKFTPEGHITVRAQLEDAEQWRLEVEDTGIGMSHEAQARAFEEYFTGGEASSIYSSRANTTRGQSGVGLGLAITRRLCTVLNTEITLESMPGKGTCFRLLLPRRLTPPGSQESQPDSTEKNNVAEQEATSMPSSKTNPTRSASQRTRSIGQAVALNREVIPSNGHPPEVAHVAPLLQSLFRATDYGVLMTDLKGNDVLCNPRFGTLFGVDTEEIVRLPREEVRKIALSRVADPMAFTELVERAYADPWLEFEDEMALKAPRPSVLRRHTGPVLDEQGEVLGRIWTFLDVTETRQLQAEVASYTRRLEERLQQQALALKSAQDQLLQTVQMRAVGTLAMGIAHDLRNILTTLRLEMASLGPAYQSLASTQMDRLYALTHCLLALSEEAPQPLGPVDLNEIIDFVFKLIYGQAEIDGIVLEKQFRRGIPPVHGNPRRLEHLFVNLLTNALNAVAAQGGQVTVEVCQDHGRVRVDVRDTGPGIPPENLPHLFEPFFTTHANRTGLGLFSARRIVEAHGGEIKITSQKGHGTCVSVWLPTQ